MGNWETFSAPEWNQGSYQEPVPVPGVEPGAAPLVCVQFNEHWLLYVLGALFQLTQPAIYDPTSGDVSVAQQQAQTLMAIIGSAGECTDMLTFRFTDTCILQYSVDGGTTWVDVPGWDTFSPSCFTGPEGPAGPVGPAGGFDPGTPPYQPGQTTSQLACSVAGFIATEIIQAGVSETLSGFNLGHDVVDIATAILTTIIGGPLVGVVATTAVNALYNAIASGTTAHFTSALSDPTLWADVTCAIFAATSGDGYVTSSNFAAVEAAICAIGYVYPDVVSAICDYVTNLGYSGIAALQIPGAVAVVDCSGCLPPVGSNCLDFDGSTTTLVLASDLALPLEPWSIGGWFGTGGGAQYIFFAGWNGVACSTVQISVDAFNNMSCVINNSACEGPRVLSLGTRATGVPVHIVITGGGGGYTAYKNGSSTATAAALAHGNLTSSGAHSAWAKQPVTGAVNFGGQMWGWAAYNSALGPTQVADWHAAGTSAAPPGGAAHYWPMNEGSGTTIHDLVGGNNATAGGTVVWGTHA